jgi:hypothetical protein
MSRDRVRKGVGTGAGALAILLSVILLAWLRSSGPAKPQVEGIKQLSDDGEGKDEFARIENGRRACLLHGKVRGKFSAGSGLSNRRTGCTGEHADSCGVPRQHGAKTNFC